MIVRSTWPYRLPIAALALAGCGISAYLSLYELGLTKSVWDPIFGTRSSEAVLRSRISRAMPVPDAALGVAAYATEAALALAGDAGTVRRPARRTLLFAAVVNALALAGVGQIVVQRFLARSLCSLCLSIAGISFLNAWLARDETGAALGHLKRRAEGSAGILEAIGPTGDRSR